MGLLSSDGPNQDNAVEPRLVLVYQLVECVPEHNLEFTFLLDALPVLVARRVFQFPNDTSIRVLYKYVHVQHQVVHSRLEGLTQRLTTLQ